MNNFSYLKSVESIVFVQRIFFTLICSSKSAWIEAFATDSNGSMFVWFNIFRTTSTFTGRSISELSRSLAQARKIMPSELYRLNRPLNPCLQWLQVSTSYHHISKQQQKASLTRFWILSSRFRHLKTSLRSSKIPCLPWYAFQGRIKSY